jgi:hypothetical protein
MCATGRMLIDAKIKTTSLNILRPFPNESAEVHYHRSVDMQGKPSLNRKAAIKFCLKIFDKMYHSAERYEENDYRIFYI